MAKFLTIAFLFLSQPLRASEAEAQKNLIPCAKVMSTVFYAQRVAQGYIGHEDPDFEGYVWLQRYENEQQGGFFQITGRGIERLIRENEVLHEYLDPKNLVGKTVLDVGAGSGSFVKELSDDYGIEAYAVDLIETPKNKNLKYFVQADATALPFTNASIDVFYSANSIFSYLMFGYKGDKVIIAALEEMQRVLKPGGTAVLIDVDSLKEYSAAIKQVNGLKVIKRYPTKGQRGHLIIKKS